MPSSDRSHPGRVHRNTGTAVALHFNCAPANDHVPIGRATIRMTISNVPGPAWHCGHSASSNIPIPPS